MLLRHIKQVDLVVIRYRYFTTTATGIINACKDDDVLGESDFGKSHAKVKKGAEASRETASTK